MPQISGHSLIMHCQVCKHCAAILSFSEHIHRSRRQNRPFLHVIPLCQGIQQLSQYFRFHNIGTVGFKPFPCQVILPAKHHVFHHFAPLPCVKIPYGEVLKILIQCLGSVRIIIVLQNPQRKLRLKPAVRVFRGYHSQSSLYALMEHPLVNTIAFTQVEIQFQIPRIHRQQPPQKFSRYHQFFDGIFHTAKKLISPCVLKHNGIMASVQRYPRLFLQKNIFRRAYISLLVYIYFLKPHVLHPKQMRKQQSGKKGSSLLIQHFRPEQFLV